MVESVAPVSPAVAVTQAQAAQASAPASSAGGAANANAVSAYVQAAALQSEEQELSVGQTSASGSSSSGVSDETLLNGALNLSPQALNALNGVNAGSTSGLSINGALTPLQLEEIATLQYDAQILNQVNPTATVVSDESQTDSAITVALSAQAVNILNDINSGNSVGARNTLTPAQLQQIAEVITPFINQPFTQATLLQMQDALIAASFNPAQLSLQTYYLCMNYLAAESEPITLPDDNQQEVNATIVTEASE